jgi:hypothetical protein
MGLAFVRVVISAFMFLGPVERAFGHPGAGGSTHGAWPDAHVGFS